MSSPPPPPRISGLPRYGTALRASLPCWQPDTGARLFAKAAPASEPFIYPQYLREAQVVPLMPAGMPMPDLRAAEHLTVDGERWVLLVYAAVDGVMPGHPWTDTDLLAVEQSCTEAVARTRSFPDRRSGEYSGDPIAEDMAGVPSQFRPVAEGLPAPGSCPAWAPGRPPGSRSCWTSVR